MLFFQVYAELYWDGHRWPVGVFHGLLGHGSWPMPLLQLSWAYFWYSYGTSLRCPTSKQLGLGVVVFPSTNHHSWQMISQLQ